MINKRDVMKKPETCIAHVRKTEIDEWEIVRREETLPLENIGNKI